MGSLMDGWMDGEGETGKKGRDLPPGGTDATAALCNATVKRPFSLWAPLLFFFPSQQTNRLFVFRRGEGAEAAPTVNAGLVSATLIIILFHVILFFLSLILFCPFFRHQSLAPMNLKRHLVGSFVWCWFDRR
ncbi:hypothetical protein LY78DRAFT_228299 [Colletotrichum sublineola]|nr:hypothetical protein LY78DRAFT_455587 [Colletotrichum sublineola]KAK1962725.1 hypothetical protein LY78DRAFT_228299 [Colletotrichum sublineola]